MVDAFVGKFVVEKRENFDGFMKGIGVPEEYVEKARNAEVKTEISKNGDVISVTRIRPMKTTTNSFSFGKESEVENIKGEKMKVVVNFEGGKIVSRGDNYEVTQEMDGGRLKEVITFKGHTMTRYSKRQ
ncbi:fatty acid-binding protein 10-A, liver basic-like [Clavelina lepadiformis]|uniref:fatty acid-binding protein 10-A, liver basic-like n=1 Tax=Clavelina lepadiformis TaxID=159417 RepID=UPI0040422431